MYFLPRHNRLYAAIAHAKPMYRYISTVLLLMSIVFGWRMSIYAYGKIVENRYRAEIAHAQSHQKMYKNAARARKKLRAALEVAQEELSHYNKIGAASCNEHTAILHFIAQAEQANLVLGSCVLGKKYIDEGISSHEVTVTCQGSFAAIASFLQSLKDFSLLDFQRINIRGGDGRVYTLSCSCMLHILI